MDARAVAALRCPHPACADDGGLRRAGRTLRCRRGHAYDLARQGYVNLVHGRDPGTGDDAAMVAARDEVLEAGHLEVVTAALAATFDAHLDDAAGDAGDAARVGGVLVDLGAGTGHHLAAVLDRLPDRVGIGVDLSRPAARRAARAHPRAAVVVADVWRGLPLRTGSAAAVSCVFAPRNGAEIARVLAPGGVLVTVTPAADHLASLVGPLGLLAVDGDKERRLLDTLAPHLAPSGPARRVSDRRVLDHEQVRAVVAMGPSADHLDAGELADAVAKLPDGVEVEVAVEVRRFVPTA